MKISIDTKEDSHEEIAKVIRMLQNLVGDSQEVFTNQPSSESSASITEDAITNILADTPNLAQETPSAEQASQESQTEEAQAEKAPQSTEDLFAELFSEEELKKMEATPVKEEDEKEEEELPKTKSKKYSIELY